VVACFLESGFDGVEGVEGAINGKTGDGTGLYGELVHYLLG
jgi:hypothetical protein